MNKIMIMFIVVAVVMTLTACENTAKKQFGEINNNIVLVKKHDSFTGSVSDLLSIGKKQKCIWHEAGKVVGVVYTDGNNARTELNAFTLNDVEKNKKTIAINDGKWTWTWTEGAKKGVKVKNSNGKMNSADIPIVTDVRGIDIIDDSKDNMEEEMHDYKCIDWSINSKIFMPPMNIKFIDMQQMRDNMKNAAKNGIPIIPTTLSQ